MRTFASVLTIIMGLAVIMAGSALASDAQTEYYMTVGDYYNISYDDVLDMVDMGMADEELPVAVAVAQKSNVAPEEVARLRMLGKSWPEVVSAYGLDAKSFYVIVCGTFESNAFTPTFEKYRTTTQSQWQNIELTGDEIVNLVNLRVMYSHHDYSVFSIMAMRDFDRSYVKINSDVARAKAELHRKQVAMTLEQTRTERAARQKAQSTDQ